jgi:hypothetical protein
MDTRWCSAVVGGRWRIALSPSPGTRSSAHSFRNRLLVDETKDSGGAVVIPRNRVSELAPSRGGGIPPRLTAARAIVVSAALLCVSLLPACGTGYTCGTAGEAKLKELGDHLRSVDGVTGVMGPVPCGSGQAAYLVFEYTTDVDSVVSKLTTDPSCLAGPRPGPDDEPVRVVNCFFSDYRAEIAVEEKATLQSSATVYKK